MISLCMQAVHSGADLESAIETCLGFFPKVMVSNAIG